MFRDDLEKHFKTEDHQKVVLLCFNQVCLQLKEQLQVFGIVNNQMETERSDVLSKDTTSSSTITTPEILSDDLENFLNLINIFSGGIQSLRNDLILLNDGSFQQSQSIEMVENKLSTIKLSIEESNNVLNAIDTNLLILQEKIDLLKETFDDCQVSSYDGTLVWKIDRFQGRMSKNIGFL